MKNAIKYYYNLNIDNFKKTNDNFEFQINKKKYEFIPFNGDINFLYKNYMLVLQRNKYCHEIVQNKENSLLTYYNGKSYILIKKNIIIDKYVNIDEINNYSIPVFGNYTLNWKKMWESKIDYYEYQISQLGFKFPMLRNSFNYYCGLTESAICLLNYIAGSKIRYSICHRRITYKEKLDEFYNPVEIVIDNKTRDIAEYIKINYINDKMSIVDVYNILEKLYFDNNEAILFLSRLIYPSYYFDLYDQILQENTSESKMQFYIEKNVKYETFLKKIYLYLKSKYYIPEIEWLTSVN